MKLDLQEPRNIELVSAGAHRVRKDARRRDDGSYFDVASLGLVNSPLTRSQFASRTGPSARAGSPTRFVQSQVEGHAVLHGHHRVFAGGEQECRRGLRGNVKLVVKLMRQLA